MKLKLMIIIFVNFFYNPTTGEKINSENICKDIELEKNITELLIKKGAGVEKI